MNLEKDFENWLEQQDIKWLEKKHSGSIFKKFIDDVFTVANYSDISRLINNAERQKLGKPPIRKKSF